MDTSLSNSITFDKLTGTFQNFENWMFSIQCLLTEQDLWDVCTKEVNAEDANEKKKDAKAWAKIGNACDASVIPIIRSTKTAYEMINRLRAHAHGGLKKRLSLIKTLLSIRYNGNMQEYVNRVSLTQKELQGIGAPVDDGFLAMYMLAGLPEGFEHIVTRLDDPDVQITLEIVGKELLKEGDDAVPGTSGSQQTMSQSQQPDYTCEKCRKTFKSTKGLKHHTTRSKGNCLSDDEQISGTSAENGTDNHAQEGAATASKRAKRAEQPVPQPSPAPLLRAPPPRGTPTAPPSLRETHTVRSLRPYTDQWTIKARVMKKSPIKSWQNKKDKGNYFSVDLTDGSGVIRAVAFRDDVGRFYEKFQVGGHYYISNAQVKRSEPKYKELNNDYELTLNSNSVVAECMDP